MGRPPKVQKLTQKQIDQLAPGTRRTYVWLNDPRGFGISIQPGGTKNYVLQFRTAEGKHRFLNIGPTDGLSLEEARRMARETGGEVAKGTDPVAEVEAARAAKAAEEERLSQRHTLGTFWQMYVADAEKRLKPRTLTDMRRLWKAVIEPALAKVPLEELRRAQIAAMHRERSDTPVQANRALAHLRAALSRAIEWGMLETDVNPAARIRLYPEKSREFRMEPEQWAAYLKAIDQLEDTGEGGWKRNAQGRYVEGERGLSPFSAALFRLIAFTGMRRAEAMGLRWREVNFDAEVLSLEDSKTGARVVYCGPEAMKELRRLEAIRTQDDWVFESPQGGKRMAEPWCRLALIRETGKLPMFSVHGLRHAVGSHLADLGYPESPTIQAILGHRQRSVTGRYIHATRKPFQEAVAEHERALLAYKEGKAATVKGVSDLGIEGVRRQHGQA